MDRGCDADADADVHMALADSKPSNPMNTTIVSTTVAKPQRSEMTDNHNDTNHSRAVVADIVNEASAFAVPNNVHGSNDANDRTNDKPRAKHEEKDEEEHIHIIVNNNRTFHGPYYKALIAELDSCLHCVFGVGVEVGDTGGGGGGGVGDEDGDGKLVNNPNATQSESESGSNKTPIVVEKYETSNMRSYYALLLKNMKHQISNYYLREFTSIQSQTHLRILTELLCTNNDTDADTAAAVAGKQPQRTRSSLEIFKATQINQKLRKEISVIDGLLLQTEVDKQAIIQDIARRKTQLLRSQQ